MTTRIEGDPLDARWRGMAAGATLITVDLSPLAPADSLTIARRFIDGDAFAAQCVERAGGNPLFLEQLLRTAGDLTDGQLAELDPKRRAGPHRSSVRAGPARDSGGLGRSGSASASPISGRCSESRAIPATRCCETCSCVRRSEVSSSPMRWCAMASMARSPMRGDASSTRPPPRFSSTIRCCAPNIWIAPATPKRRAPISRRPKQQAALFRYDQAVALAARGLAIAAAERDIVDLALLLGDLQQDAGRGTDALEAYRPRAGGKRGRAGPAPRLLGLRRGQSADRPARRRLFRLGRGRAARRRRAPTIARSRKSTISAAISISRAATCRPAAASTNRRSKRRGGSIRRNGRPGR